MKINNVTMNFAKVNGGGREASQIAISEQLKSQSKGLEQATQNIENANNLAQTAEGAFNSINDSLGRIRELAVQASNGIMTDDQKNIIQEEINQLKLDIQDTSQNSNFNTIELLDSGFSGVIQSGANQGQGTPMEIKTTTLETLGISDFDVTNDFDISTIDEALEQVSQQRSKLGAVSNRFEASANANRIAQENLQASESKFDQSIEEIVMEMKEQMATQQMKIATQRNQMQLNESKLDILG